MSAPAIQRALEVKECILAREPIRALATLNKNLLLGDKKVLLRRTFVQSHNLPPRLCSWVQSHSTLLFSMHQFHLLIPALSFVDVLNESALLYLNLHHHLSHSLLLHSFMHYHTPFLHFSHPVTLPINLRHPSFTRSHSLILPPYLEAPRSPLPLSPCEGLVDQL